MSDKIGPDADFVKLAPTRGDEQVWTTDLTDTSEHHGTERDYPSWRLIEGPAQSITGFSSYIVGNMPTMTGKAVPPHVGGLLAYLAASKEKANDDLAVGYFRQLYGDAFKRQQDAKNADGYVPGSFVLELKGDTSDWHSGLLQGLAYSKFLDFSAVVVIAKGFLGLWRVDAFSQELLEVVRGSAAAPSKVGKQLARQYSAYKRKHLELALWLLPGEVVDPLFADEAKAARKLKEFEACLKAQKRVRLKITPRNFTNVLEEMIPFFEKPLSAARAFYSVLYNWKTGAVFEPSSKHLDHGTFGGELITGLVPDRRDEFKTLVEGYEVSVGPSEHLDDFFARYDEALDAVDPEFRIKHGIFFTDLNLSKFALWLAKRHVGDLGKNYLVIDPACGSGNLVTNWRSPLEIRHKVVSEIEAELLFAVERRMMLDSWHDGKFTVVPKVSEGRGLNFLDVSAEDYLGTLTKYLAENGHKPDKPIAFLCNPPYRSDDDQAAKAISYAVHPSIVALTGNDAASERYCCFLAQMKLMCQAAKESGLPGDSLLLVFTKSAWMTDRAIYQQIRSEMLSSYELLDGILVNGAEFFDIGKFPVAFSVWRHVGANALSSARPVKLRDLTWVRWEDLRDVPWADEAACDQACENLLADKRTIRVGLGVPRQRMREWSGATMVDFKRDRRKNERGVRAGGLPVGAEQEKNKKAYGEADGPAVGFMDELTPCRVKPGNPTGVPWFRLNNQFMDCRKTRCFSGQPTHFGFCATNSAEAEKMFVWFALGRTFAAHSYPMWTDQMDMWAPTIPPALRQRVKTISYAIGLAENECVETRFPADNPIQGAPEVLVINPMSPLASDSFWTMHMKGEFGSDAAPHAQAVVDAVESLYDEWRKQFIATPKLPVSYARSYFIGRGALTRNSGIMQIKDFAEEKNKSTLRAAHAEVQAALKKVRATLYEMLADEQSLNYFAEPQVTPAITKPPSKPVKPITKTSPDTPRPARSSKGRARKRA